jgi:hypothetical protein
MITLCALAVGVGDVQRCVEYWLKAMNEHYWTGNYLEMQQLCQLFLPFQDKHKLSFIKSTQQGSLLDSSLDKDVASSVRGFYHFCHIYDLWWHSSGVQHDSAQILASVEAAFGELVLSPAASNWHKLLMLQEQQRQQISDLRTLETKNKMAHYDEQAQQQHKPKNQRAQQKQQTEQTEGAEQTQRGEEHDKQQLENIMKECIHQLTENITLLKGKLVSSCTCNNVILCCPS